ncbi:NAD(P)H-dependent oxidoreductase [Dietzia sp. PP-33]|jgi:NAD(P)H-dependent FMN reductase|uniref:NADPH-dependent FMN reductase n=1 Tax=Dietzia sp. PP-33 TaxID=2957500 RepID=UPI0029B8CA37|nr:NAD(P)H-dependent oxidoreductase [Dietzia sp. PP-33]MDX2358582.1 NAD(P)H-dependent oxidoreductase [Dietzia sp. PP-33]
MTTQTPQNSEHFVNPTRSPTRVAVVCASVRDGRVCPSIADWVVTTLEHTSGVEIDVIDLAQITLPDDSQLYPGGGPESEVAARIDAAGAFVFVTPEYNHSYPASLKRLIDWHYSEWKLKPASIVAYGVQGGYSAIEHLRGVLAELNMVTTRRCLGLPAPWLSLDDADRYVPGESVTERLKLSLAELDWWAGVLTDARADRSFPN